MLGRFEYQKGNIEAALHVFEGIDIAALAPKMKDTLSRTVETRKRRTQNFATTEMSIHAISLLLESILLKSKCLQVLGRYKGNFSLVCKLSFELQLLLLFLYYKFLLTSFDSSFYFSTLPMCLYHKHEVHVVQLCCMSFKDINSFIQSSFSLPCLQILFIIPYFGR